jgi:hypothetical protein
LITTNKKAQNLCAGNTSNTHISETELLYSSSERKDWWWVFLIKLKAIQPVKYVEKFLTRSSIFITLFRI